MADSHIVRPDTDRLTLSTGESVTIIKELNAGEYWDLLTALADRQVFAKPLAYILSWTLVGLDGQPLPYGTDLPEATRRNTIRALNKRVVREIQVLLDQHEADENAAHAKKKQTPAGTDAAPASSAT